MINLEEISKLPIVSPDIINTPTPDISLKDDEYLFKYKQNNAGFMAKMNKNGTFPVAFDKWSQHSDTMIITEQFRLGWKYHGYRSGKSASWTKLMHPFGFHVEIHAQDLGELLSNVTVINGVIQSECYFDAYSKKILIK